MKKAKAYGAVVDGMIDVATVSPSEIGAKISFLVNRVGLVLGQVPDSKVNLTFEKYCPTGTTVEELCVVGADTYTVPKDDKLALWELAAELYPNVFNRPVKTTPVLDKQGKVVGQRLEEEVSLDDPLLQEAFERVTEAFKRLEGCQEFRSREG